MTVKDLVESSASVTAAVQLYKFSATRLWPACQCASEAEIPVNTLREKHFNVMQKPDLEYGRDPGPVLPSHRDASALHRSHSNSIVFTATERFLPPLGGCIDTKLAETIPGKKDRRAQ